LWGWVSPFCYGDDQLAVGLLVTLGDHNTSSTYALVYSALAYSTPWSAEVAQGSKFELACRCADGSRVLMIYARENRTY